MKKVTILLFAAVMLCVMNAKSQEKPIGPSFIGKGVYHGLSKPLRDVPAMSADEWDKMVQDANKPRNEEMQYRSYPFASTALPQGPDEVWQQKMGKTQAPKAPIVNINGQTSPYYPSDCNGTVGPNHFMQTINCVYAIYNKTGTIVAGPSNMNTLFSGVTGATYNDGDPVVLFDEQANRWVAIEFSVSGSNDYVLFAVSQTNDPTGAWYRYSFDVDDMPDYPKISIWQDGYYLAVNNSSSGKKDIYVVQRSVMLTGGVSPVMVGFDNAWRPTTIDGFMCVPPIDNDGPAAPLGTPGLFITMNDDAIGGGTDQLWIYKLAVNWATPSQSTFVRSQQINVTSFDSNFGNNWDNIPQPNTQKLDAVPQVIMNAPQYRNFGSYQTIVCCHTVDVDNTNHAGIRWYELRSTDGSTFSVRQTGTYAPDAHSRWMGSISLNGQNEIGLGYSISSSSVYPGIRYTGQTAAAYAAGAGVMDLAEQTIVSATSAQTTYNRWGDYAGISVDPTDDKTFWFTTQYGGSRQTKIASFQVGAATAQPDLFTLSQSVTPASTIDGSDVTASCTVKNQGTANAAASNLKYYLSADNAYSASDLLLSTDAVGALSAGSSASFSKSVTVPAGTAPGNYFILFYADADAAVTESLETNNVGSVQLTITSANPPDLLMTSPAVSPTSVAAGSAVTATGSVSNQGTGAAATSNLKYYLSTDAVFNSITDTYLGTDVIAALASGGAAAVNKSITIPANTGAASYYLLFVVDADAQVAESNESNNLSAVPLTVTAPPGCNSTTLYPSSTLSPNTNWKSQRSIYAGEYTKFSVTAGRVYTFSYCAADGASCSYNSFLTLRNASTDVLLATDDNSCTTDDARIVWTATFTGTVKLVTSIAGCGTNTTSSTLRYKYAAAKEAESAITNEPEFLVYPNPSNGQFSVEASSGFEGVKKIAVYTSSGKVVRTIDVPEKPENIYEFNISDQPTGIFLVKIYGATKTDQFRVVIRK